jgi:hypothetical protein
MRPQKVELAQTLDSLLDLLLRLTLIMPLRQIRFAPIDELLVQAEQRRSIRRGDCGESDEGVAMNGLQRPLYLWLKQVSHAAAPVSAQLQTNPFQADLNLRLVLEKTALDVTIVAKDGPSQESEKHWRLR